MPDAHAPGKLILCGEYAVLAGAPAIAAAVDVRARATVATSAGPARLVVPNEGHWAFDWGEDGAPSWADLPPQGRRGVLDAVAAALAAAGITMRRPLEVSLDSRAFRRARLDGPDDKLGLGSSAAITVALVAALLAIDRADLAADRAALIAICLDAHRRLQDGRGSGVDVAAAVYGGVVALIPGAERPAIRNLGWPAGLHALAAWSGEGAATRVMLARFEDFARSDARRCRRAMGELTRIASELLDAWERSDVPVVLRALTDYDDALRALDAGGDIGIHTPAHQRLAEDAQALGAAYKISGAGGGDFGIAFADSPAIIDALRSRWQDDSIVTLPVGPGVAGVTLTAP